MTTDRAERGAASGRRCFGTSSGSARPHARIRRIDRGSRPVAALFLFAAAFPWAAEAGDFTLTVDYSHQIKLMGVPAVQRGTYLLRLHMPKAIRIDLQGGSFPVIYRYETEGLVRYEINISDRRYSRMPVAEALRILQEKMRNAGVKHDMTGPAYLTAGSGSGSGWQKLFEDGNEEYLHFLLSGRVTMAAMVQKDRPCPSEKLMSAFIQELPFSTHYWVLDACTSLLKRGLVRYFEYAPQGPEYYFFHVNECREERLRFSEQMFLPPDGYTLVKQDAPTVLPQEPQTNQENRNEIELDNRLPRAPGIGAGDRTTAAPDANALLQRNEPRRDDKQEEGQRKPTDHAGQDAAPR